MPQAIDKVIYYEDWSRVVGRFSVELDVANNDDLVMCRRGLLPPEQVRRVRLRALVDTGATRLVLPGRAVAALGLEPEPAEVNVRYANGKVTRRAIVSNVYAKVQGRDGLFDAIVEPDREDALLGAVPLEVFDFLVDSKNGKLVPRDPDHIVAELE